MQYRSWLYHKYFFLEWKVHRKSSAMIYAHHDPGTGCFQATIKINTENVQKLSVQSCCICSYYTYLNVILCLLNPIMKSWGISFVCLTPFLWQFIYMVVYEKIIQKLVKNNKKHIFHYKKFKNPYGLCYFQKWVVAKTKDDKGLVVRPGNDYSLN